MLETNIIELNKMVYQIYLRMWLYGSIKRYSFIGAKDNQIIILMESTNSQDSMIETIVLMDISLALIKQKIRATKYTLAVEPVPDRNLIRITFTLQEYKNLK
jgi:hypothetical protein